jgi:hypothetical protein
MLQQLAALVQLGDASRQRAQQLLEIARPAVVVGLVRHAA